MTNKSPVQVAIDALVEKQLIDKERKFPTGLVNLEEAIKIVEQLELDLLALYEPS